MPYHPEDLWFTRVCLPSGLLKVCWCWMRCSQPGKSPCLVRCSYKEPGDGDNEKPPSGSVSDHRRHFTNQQSFLPDHQRLQSVDLAEQRGTPLYLYDRTTMDAMVDTYRAHYGWRVLTARAGISSSRGCLYWILDLES